MPDMNGAETYQEIARIRGDVPVILTSGFNREIALEDLKDSRLAGFIQKLFVIKQLQAEIQRVLTN